MLPAEAGVAVTSNTSLGFDHAQLGASNWPMLAPWLYHMGRYFVRIPMWGGVLRGICGAFLLSICLQDWCREKFRWIWDDKCLNKHETKLWSLLTQSALKLLSLQDKQHLLLTYLATRFLEDMILLNRKYEIWSDEVPCGSGKPVNEYNLTWAAIKGVWRRDLTKQFKSTPAGPFYPSAAFWDNWDNWNSWLPSNSVCRQLPTHECPSPHHIDNQAFHKWKYQTPSKG